MKKTLLALCITLVSPLYVGAQLADDYGTSSTVRGAGYCPNLSITMQRGSTDATTQGQASQLQRFLIERGYLDIDAPTGRIAGLTVQAIKDFQTENNLPAYGIAGSLTRAAIARVCSGNVTTTTTTSTNTTTGTTAGTATTLAPSATFTASTYTTTAGQPVSLAWSSTNTTSCSVRNSQTGGNGGTVLTLGTQVVYPTVTTTYTLTCINQNTTPQQEVTKTVTVVVGSTTTTTTNTTLQAPTLSVNLSPSSIVRGGSVSLSWTSTGATACTGKNAALTTSEPLALSGSRTLSPTQTTTYKIECTGANGQVVSVEKTVTVESTTTTNASTNTGVPTVGLSASSYTLTAGQSAQVAWNTADATTCTATYGGRTETVQLQGQVTVTPTQTTTYKLVCANATGSTEKSITITVTQASSSSGTGNTTTTSPNTQTTAYAPIVALSAATYSMFSGQSTQIAWNTADATACTAYYGGRTEQVSTQGLLTISPTETTTYRLVCTNGQKSAEKSITITVTPGSQAVAPTYVDMSLSPTTVGSQGYFKVSWTGNNNASTFNIKVNNTIYPQTGPSWTGTPASLGLGAGTHLFSAQACNIVGCSSWTGAYLLTVTN